MRNYSGCLNCGDLRGMVPRFIEVEYSGYTLDGDFFIKKASGLEARIIQHEVENNPEEFFFWVLPGRHQTNLLLTKKI